MHAELKEVKASLVWFVYKCYNTELEAELKQEKLLYTGTHFQSFGYLFWSVIICSWSENKNTRDCIFKAERLKREV